KPSQYRKIPFLAQSVRTTGRICVRSRSSCWSHKKKKNVLFFLMGPATVMLYSCSFCQFVWVGVHTPRTTCLLLAHVLASRAEFRAFHTALPWNSLVPERVRI